MKYTVVIAYYQGEESDDDKLKRLIESIPSREDLEIIVVHDGPLKHNIKLDGVRIISTLRHQGLCGHPSRDLGIKESNGEFILVTNHDNVYSEGFFYRLDREIESDIGMYIFIVKMMGMKKLFNGNLGYDKNVPRDNTIYKLLSGDPVEVGNIDCMQVVIAKKIWANVNYWYDNAEGS